MTLQDSLRSIDEQAVCACANQVGNISRHQLVALCQSAAKTIDDQETKLRDIAVIVEKQDCFAVEGVLSLNQRYKEACKQIVDLMHDRDAARSTGTMISYSFHDKIVKILEAKLHDAYLELERARAERDEAKANRKYATPMIVRFNHQAWEDGEYVVTIDGEPVGGSVSSTDGAKAIARWVSTAWAELIEHNTMKHRNQAATVSGVDVFGNACLQAADCPPSSKDGCQ